MSTCFSLSGNFEKQIVSLVSSHVYFAKKSEFYLVDWF